MSKRLFASIFCITVLILTGCQSGETGSFLPPARLTGSPDSITPTVAAESAPAESAPALNAPTTVAAAPAATGAPGACSNDLELLSDLTLPLGTTVEANEALDKRWLVANRGSCDWQADYRLKPVAGIALGAPELALFPARTGAQAPLRVELSAPAQPGAYRGAWQAFDPQGNSFGDPLFLEIIIK